RASGLRGDADAAGTDARVEFRAGIENTAAADGHASIAATLTDIHAGGGVDGATAEVKDTGAAGASVGSADVDPVVAALIVNATAHVEDAQSAARADKGVADGIDRATRHVECAGSSGAIPVVGRADDDIVTVDSAIAEIE